MPEDRSRRCAHRGADGPYPGKRAFDLVVASLLAVPALLAGTLGAVAVRLSSPGPVLFRQTRAGRDGEPFVILKLRTMVHDPGGNPMVPDPDRITPVGAVLRTLSLDELPQIVNVLRGEMSVVGPRPVPPYQVERYDERQRRRLAVRPGLTGLAQVEGRNALTWAERIELDLRYVEEQSLALDAWILVRTVVTLLTARGATGDHREDPIAATEDRAAPA